ncbi:MAG: hypothetical protein FK733_00010 [Asgard group archaeon]|nr:hypothetical protein [Asgard group archaeon]
MTEDSSSNSSNIYFKMIIITVDALKLAQNAGCDLHGNILYLRAEDLDKNRSTIEQIAQSNLRVELINNYLLYNKSRYSLIIDKIFEAQGKFGLQSRNSVIKKLKDTIYQKLADKNYGFYKQYVPIKKYFEYVVLPLNVFSGKEQHQLLFDADAADDKIENFVSSFDRAREIRKISQVPFPTIVYVKDQLGLEGEYKKVDLPIVLGNLNNTIREQVRLAYYKDPKGFDKILPILKKRMLKK